MTSTMRTTVVLDDDVLAKLQFEARSRGQSFKVTLNAVIRDGLVLAEQSRAAQTFRVKPRSIGLKPGLSYDSISSLIDLAEGDDAR